MDQRTLSVSATGRIGVLDGKPVVYSWAAPYGQVLDTGTHFIVRPTNDLVWNFYYRAIIDSERAKGKKYVANLFKGLRFSLGLPLK